MDRTELYLSESKNVINTNLPNPVYEDVESNLDNFYNNNKSESKEITNITKFSFKGGDHKGIVINDYLQYKLSSNYIFKEKN